MYEIWQQFEVAFAIENCKAVQVVADKKDHTIAWATFVKRAMNNHEQRKNLTNKRKNQKETMSGKVVPCIGLDPLGHVKVKGSWSDDRLACFIYFDQLQNLHEITEMSTRVGSQISRTSS